MDLISLDRIRAAHDRTELALGPRSAPLAGGTWLFSEPQPGLEELVDLTTLGWPAIGVTDDGLTLAATCTIRSLADLPAVQGGEVHRPPSEPHLRVRRVTANGSS